MICMHNRNNLPWGREGEIKIFKVISLPSPFPILLTFSFFFLFSIIKIFNENTSEMKIKLRLRWFSRSPRLFNCTCYYEEWFTIRLNVINRDERDEHRCEPGITFNQDNLFYRIDSIALRLHKRLLVFSIIRAISFFTIDFGRSKKKRKEKWRDFYNF